MGFQGCNLLQSSLEWIVLFVKGNGSDRRRDRRHSLRFFSPLLGYVGQQSKRHHTFRILSRSRAFSRCHFTGRCVLHLQRTYSWPWRLARDIFGTFRTLRHTVSWSFLFPDDQCKCKWARNTKYKCSWFVVVSYFVYPQQDTQTVSSEAMYYQLST